MLIDHDHDGAPAGLSPGAPSFDPAVAITEATQELLGLEMRYASAVQEAPGAGIAAARAAGVTTIVGVGEDVDPSQVSASVLDLRGITFDGTHLSC